MDRREFLGLVPPLFGGAILASAFDAAGQSPGDSGDGLLTWVLVRFPYVTGWTKVREQQFAVRARGMASPGATVIPFSFYGIADTRQAVFFAHLDKGHYAVTATADAGLPSARWRRTDAIEIVARYPASLQMDISMPSSGLIELAGRAAEKLENGPPSAVKFELEGQTYLIDGSLPTFAIVLADFRSLDSALAASAKLRQVFESACAEPHPGLRRAETGEWFFLFRVRDELADRIFELLQGWNVDRFGSGLASGRVLVAVVVRETDGLADLVVIDPRAIDDVSVRDRGYPPRKVTYARRPPDDYDKLQSDVLRGNALGIFLGMAKGANGSLRVLFELPPSAGESAEGPVGDVDAAVRREPFNLLPKVEHAVLLDDAVNAQPVVIGSIEEGAVLDSHPLVDAVNLKRMMNCGDSLVEVVSGQMAAAGCGPSDIEHATAVYGMLSSRIPLGDGLPTVEVACAPGNVTGLEHLAISMPIAQSAPIGAAKRLADLLRWMTDLPLQHRTQTDWPSLAQIVSQPVRVINISRHFSEIGVGAETVGAAWDVLAHALEEVTTQAFGGKGAVIVLSADNAGTLVSELDLSLPCRNSILIVTATAQDGGQGRRLSVNSGPPVSVFAPSKDVGLLNTAGPDECRVESGTYTSYATPVVSGVAARVAMANPDLSAVDIATIVRETATVVDANRSGVGRWVRLNRDRTRMMDPMPATFPINENPALDSGDLWFSLWYGHGRADPVAAVARALQS